MLCAEIAENASFTLSLGPKELYGDHTSFAQPLYEVCTRAVHILLEYVETAQQLQRHHMVSVQSPHSLSTALHSLSLQEIA